MKHQPLNRCADCNKLKKWRDLVYKAPEPGDEYYICKKCLRDNK